MKTGCLWLCLLIPGIAACATDPSKRLSATDRSRFLYLAVLEGLEEEGPAPEAIKAVLEPKDGRTCFVLKCPICECVRLAMHVYLARPDAPYGDPRGRAFPKDIAAGLLGTDRKAKLDALEKLVERYVSRRFDRFRMSDADRAQMRQLLEEGKKEGMTHMKQDFERAGCPSCTGATEKKK